MLDRALAEGFAFPAVNVTSSQTLDGILRGLADARSDGIVQISVGGARYLGGGNALAGVRAFAAMARELAASLDVLVAVHSDHAPPDTVDGFPRPLLAASARRRVYAPGHAHLRPGRGSCATARRRSPRRCARQARRRVLRSVRGRRRQR